MKLWRKYIDSVKGELKTDRFETVSFRSKRKGWHEYIHSFVAGNKEYVSAGAVKDPFFTIFFDNHVLNGSCYECELRSTMEYTDIRLGDYWGAKHGLDSKGVSAVALSSQRGVNLFDEIATDVEFRSTCFEDIIAAQSYALNYEFKQKARQRTLNLLDSDLDMWEIYRDYLKGYDMKMKIKRQARIAFSLLPRVLRFRCKTLYHRITT